VVSQIAGQAGEMLLDASGAGIRFQQLVAAQDALLMLGAADAALPGPLATSRSNEFTELIGGLTVSVHGAANESVQISVTQTEEPILQQLDLFVEQYNKLVDKLDELTFFDEQQNTAGVLFGSVETLRIEFGFSNLLTARFSGSGPIRSLEELGLSVGEDGKLELDGDKFRQRYTEDPAAIETFFAEEQFGVAARFKTLTEQLSGEGNSLLLSRNTALQQSIQQNSGRISALTAALDSERESLLEQFFRLETVIGRLQSDLSAVSQIQRLPPLFSSNNRRT
jgi:flagellar hook-associated protein 2